MTEKQEPATIPSREESADVPQAYTETKLIPIRESEVERIDPCEGLDEDAANAVKAQAGVGMPGTIKLEHFGREVHDAFGHRAYLVGSVLRTREWRDVDVRLILPDDEFDALFGQLTRPRCANERWNAYCLAFAARGREVTGLPIDFQIDRETEANEDYPEPRAALGITLGLDVPDRRFREAAFSKDTP